MDMRLVRFRFVSYTVMVVFYYQPRIKQAEQNKKLK
jgi:hypothetical protein